MCPSAKQCGQAGIPRSVNRGRHRGGLWPSSPLAPCPHSPMGTSRGSRLQPEAMQLPWRHCRSPAELEGPLGESLPGAQSQLLLPVSSPPSSGRPLSKQAGEVCRLVGRDNLSEHQQAWVPVPHHLRDHLSSLVCGLAPGLSSQDKSPL